MEFGNYWSTFLSKGLYYITLIRQAVLTEHHVIAFLMQLYNLKNSSICWCCQKIHIIFIFHAIRCICARQRKCILFRLKDYYFTTHLTTQVGFDFISWYSMYTLEMDQGLETWISSIIGLQKGKLKEAFHQFLSNILAGLIIFNILFTLLFRVITTKKRLKILKCLQN